METGFGETMSRQPTSPTCSGSDSSDAGNFECNICFELAQDPIVTLCGHLYCWPCLYKWLHIHSRSQECPVCRAGIEEEMLVPLYGQGKNSTDPCSESIIGKRAKDFTSERPSASGSSQPPQEAPQPPPRRRSVTSRINELYAWARYQNEYQTISSAHLTSMDALLRGMATNMGLDPSVYPAPRPYPPPFRFQYPAPSQAQPEDQEDQADYDDN